MANAIETRRRSDGLWDVVDAEREEAIVVDGMPLTGLDAEEAEDALRRLRAGELTPDNPETPLAGESASVRYNQG
jgi:hypothetical protein